MLNPQSLLHGHAGTLMLMLPCRAESGQGCSVRLAALNNISNICVMHELSMNVARTEAGFGAALSAAASKLRQHYLIETNLPFCGSHQNI